MYPQGDTPMADEKKSEGSITFLNKSKRHYDLGLGADGKPRRHAPGATMTYTPEEAKRMASYSSDLIDITKLPGSVDVRKLKADNAALLSENAELKKQLAAFEPKAEEPVAEVEDAPKAEPRKWGRSAK